MYYFFQPARHRFTVGVTAADRPSEVLLFAARSTGLRNFDSDLGNWRLGYSPTWEIRMQPAISFQRALEDLGHGDFVVASIFRKFGRSRSGSGAHSRYTPWFGPSRA